MNWKDICLGDVLHIKHGFAFKSKYFSSQGEYVVLTPGNFHEAGGFRLRPGKDRYYIGDIPEMYILKENNLIVVMTEQAFGLLGSSALIPKGGLYLHNQRLGLVNTLNENIILNEFLYLLFNTQDVRSQISNSASGVKVRHTSPERIYKVKVKLPSLIEQKKIVSIIFCYDNLIENNRRRIQLLEKTARTLYKEWFVRLRFPGHEHVKVVDGVPEGWERKTLSDICINVHNAVDPMKISANTPYIGLEHMPRRSISLGEWGSAGAVTSTKLAFQTGDILFGKIRSYFHKVGITFVDGITSSDAVVLSPSNEKFRMYVLSIVSSDEFVNISAKTAKQGSKMPRSDWNYLMKLPILIPKDSLLESYNENIYLVVEQLKALSLMNRKLAQARDLLLPKLMNGEVAV